MGCCRGVLTLEKGSRFDCPPAARIGKLDIIKGGVVVLHDDKRFIEVREDIAIIRMEKQPKQLVPLALETSINSGQCAKKQQYMISVSQGNEKEETVGGASVIYFIR